MRTMSLQLNSAARVERIDGVTSFVGRDASGSFGILPGRARFMTILGFGLARFCDAGGAWRYLACPGAVLHFAAGELTVNTRRYLVGTDHAGMVALLSGQLAKEERELERINDNLQRLEQELFRRLRRLHGGEA